MPQIHLLEKLAQLVMALEDVLTVLVPDIPEEILIAQDAMGQEDVKIVEEQEEWL